MTQFPSDMLLGAVVLAVLLPLLYFAVRFVARVRDRWSAVRLAPLAAAVGGQASAKPPRIVLERGGRTLQLSYLPQAVVGTGDSATRMNEFVVHVLDVAGAQHWRAVFQVSGLFGQGAKRLQLEVQDQGLVARLVATGLLAEVEAVCHPTQPYAAAIYDVRQRLLMLVDDVAPKTLPDASACERLIAAALRVAALNEQANVA